MANSTNSIVSFKQEEGLLLTTDAMCAHHFSSLNFSFLLSDCIEKEQVCCAWQSLFMRCSKSKSSRAICMRPDLGLRMLHWNCSLVSLDLIEFKDFQDTHTLLSPEDGVLDYLTSLQLHLKPYSKPKRTCDLGEAFLALLTR